MRDPKFHNRDGSLTRYALACGYVQQRGFGRCQYPVIMAMPAFTVQSARYFAKLDHEGACYHVRRVDIMKPGVIAWDSFRTLGEARRAYRAAVAWARNAARGEAAA